MQSWPAFGENGVVCNGSFGKRTSSKVYAWGVLISEMGLPASEDCCNVLYTLRLWCIMTSMFAQVRKSLEAFMQSSKCMFDVHSFPAIRSLLVRWARSAARRWRRARGPSAKFPPTCSMPSWPESSEISSSEEVWRTASSVPWREQNNDAGKQGFSSKKMYKKCIHMFLSTVAGRHVWRTVKIEISDLKKAVWKLLRRTSNVKKASKLSLNQRQASWNDIRMFLQVYRTWPRDKWRGWRQIGSLLTSSNRTRHREVIPPHQYHPPVHSNCTYVTTLYNRTYTCIILYHLPLQICQVQRTSLFFWLFCWLRFRWIRFGCFHRCRPGRRLFRPCEEILLLLRRRRRGRHASGGAAATRWRTGTAMNNDCELPLFSNHFCYVHIAWACLSF